MKGPLQLQEERVSHPRRRDCRVDPTSSSPAVSSARTRSQRPRRVILKPLPSFPRSVIEHMCVASMARLGNEKPRGSLLGDAWGRGPLINMACAGAGVGGEVGPGGESQGFSAQTGIPHPGAWLVGMLGAGKDPKSGICRFSLSAVVEPGKVVGVLKESLEIRAGASCWGRSLG